MMEAASLDAAGRPEAGASAALVPWWSFTKTLLAAAVLRLAERGAVTLDAPMPGLGATPRQVLRHRAGLGDYGALPAYRAAVASGAAPWTEAEFLARVAHPGGDGFAYSNIGYGLLRREVERAAGASLARALPELVLGPLGLHGARVATTRAEMDGTAFPGGHGYHPGWVFHGLVVGPTVEAALALHRLLQGDLLSPAAMREAMPVPGTIPGRPWRRAGYGLGLMIGTMGDAGGELAVLGHSAGGPGSVAAVYHAPATGRTAAVFAAGEDGGAAEHAVLKLLR